jgi:hypothetical protein
LQLLGLGLWNASLTCCAMRELTMKPTDLNLLSTSSFSCKNAAHPTFIDHKTFIDFINQAFYQKNLEQRPLTVPIKHLPSYDDSLNFLDFEKRCIISNALQKLSRYHDDASNMKSFFEDRGGENGIISKQSFEQVLCVCGLIELVTPKEVEVLFKGFSKAAGPERKFDYKNFVMVLSKIGGMR